MEKEGASGLGNRNCLRRSWWCAGEHCPVQWADGELRRCPPEGLAGLVPEVLAAWGSGLAAQEAELAAQDAKLAFEGRVLAA